VSRKWWQRRSYFYLPVVIFGGFGLYKLAVGDWSVAIIYLVTAAFFVLVAEWKYERYGGDG
jgi:hypothetical protein